MKFGIQTDEFNTKAKTCLVVGIFEGGELTPTANKLNKISRQFITNLLKKGDFTGQLGSTFLLYNIPNVAAERLLLVGCGKSSALTERAFRKILLDSTKSLIASKTTHAISYLTELHISHRDSAWKIQQAVQVCSEAIYTFQEYKSKKEPPYALKEIEFHCSDKKHLAEAKEALKQGLAITAGVEFTKNLANQPSNVCTPDYLAQQAQQLAKEYKNIKVTILDKKALEKLGMGAFLAVAKGSDKEPKLICFDYKGSSKKQAPIAFVGKGITFDTGGISLKPADSMVGMKYDMCGAATVFGTLKAAAELKLPLNLVGIVAAAENMPSSTAAKPEDIVTTLSGQTVEIMNTDAEGRLILGDALTYCERYKPEAVIDIATLTGAVVIALGIHASGLLANHEPLAKELLAAGNDIFDRAWQLPLWDEYQDQLKSPFADMSNVGGRMGGTITAACFLSRFAKNFHWAHLDVAGTAAMMMGGNDRYATGRPVPLLMQYLINKIK